MQKEFPIVYDTKVLAHSVKRAHKERADGEGGSRRNLVIFLGDVTFHFLLPCNFLLLPCDFPRCLVIFLTAFMCPSPVWPTLLPYYILHLCDLLCCLVSFPGVTFPAALLHSSLVLPSSPTCSVLRCDLPRCRVVSFTGVTIFAVLHRCDLPRYRVVYFTGVFFLATLLYLVRNVWDVLVTGLFILLLPLTLILLLSVAWIMIVTNLIAILCDGSTSITIIWHRLTYDDKGVVEGYLNTASVVIYLLYQFVCSNRLWKSIREQSNINHW